MKFLIVLAVVAVAAARPGEDTYDPRYDNFDVDEIINNTRLMKSYSLCFRGEGKCTPDGKNFKNWIPDAVHTDCGKCTDKQKVMVAKVIKAMKAKLPEELEELIKIHDPEKKRTAELDAYVAKYAP